VKTIKKIPVIAGTTSFYSKLFAGLPSDVAISDLEDLAIEKINDYLLADKGKSSPLLKKLHELHKAPSLAAIPLRMWNRLLPLVESIAPTQVHPTDIPIVRDLLSPRLCDSFKIFSVLYSILLRSASTSEREFFVELDPFLRELDAHWDTMSADDMSYAFGRHEPGTFVSAAIGYITLSRPDVRAFLDRTLTLWAKLAVSPAFKHIKAKVASEFAIQLRRCLKKEHVSLLEDFAARLVEVPDLAEEFRRQLVDLHSAFQSSDITHAMKRLVEASDSVRGNDAASLYVAQLAAQLVGKSDGAMNALINARGTLGIYAPLAISHTADCSAFWIAVFKFAGLNSNNNKQILALSTVRKVRESLTSFITEFMTESLPVATFLGEFANRTAQQRSLLADLIEVVSSIAFRRGDLETRATLLQNLQEDIQLSRNLLAFLRLRRACPPDLDTAIAALDAKNSEWFSSNAKLIDVTRTLSNPWDSLYSLVQAAKSVRTIIDSPSFGRLFDALSHDPVSVKEVTENLLGHAFNTYGEIVTLFV
jgi:hypothetical protein